MLHVLRREALSNVFARVVLCAFVFASSGNSYGDEYGDARAELIAAYQAEDYGAMRTAAIRALDARPGYPGARFNLALAQVLGGDTDGSLKTLNDLVAAGIDYQAADTEEFTALQGTAGWDAYERAVSKLHEPVGSASIAYTYDVADFVPEGIAINAAGELFLGSIRHGTIVRIGDSARTISTASGNGHWSVFGMRFDRDGGLWFASAAVPQFASVNASSAGHTGLFRMDPETQQITNSALLPSGDEPLVLGDLVIADDDTIYASESLAGILYHYSISERKFTEVVPRGVLRSMQGLVLDQSGQYLYVADYVGGLFRVALASGDVARVSADESVSLFGIDGLYRYGNELIAVQNGISPHRVVALTLAADGLDVSEHRTLAMNIPEFDEPTLGVVVGSDFYVVANSHWNQFDRDGNLPDDLTGPIIMKIPL